MDIDLSSFDVVHEDVAIGELRLQIARPRSAEDLIDESDYARDERLPYWAELWPSARVLACELATRDLAGTRLIELGCGVGLPTVVAARRGAEAIATDWYADALTFVRANADDAEVAVTTRLLDWNDPPDDLLTPGRACDLVVGADLLYEKRNGPALAALLPRLVKPGAQALIADPRRPHAEELLVPLIDDGWAHELTAIEHAERPDESGRVIHLHRLTAPGG